MRAGLGACPSSHVLLDLLPLSSVESESFQEAVVFFLLPPAYIHIGVRIVFEGAVVDTGSVGLVVAIVETVGRA